MSAPAANGRGVRKLRHENLDCHFACPVNIPLAPSAIIVYYRGVL